ncbi:Quercetin 2,3-dioxygenase [Acaryochloris thomasi RCC1774]|uniref:Quercetin 2,3-dioxygenase n=1 Tax=Acaryochloris thomasi RCC1774 TaxID=1764569 RepID=A0A2W1J707_9CYAN|nr:pirin family protein [Acaryochloris thomasi]PZD70320.1 Quercetin 2,3-dioxygenase [Acaryochloris thomasi RCC1774]
MITIRPGNERGSANFGWLDSRHTFSFGNYFDPAHMGFSALRVINEDKVHPAQGFSTHSHRDMEIISYVLNGALEHKDNIGNGSIIRPGDIQRMSAGTGISHSEYNPSQSEGVHFLQIWLMPDTQGIEPSYEQIYISPAERQGQLRLVGSRDGRHGSVTIHQDVNLYAGLLTEEQQVKHIIEPGRAVWLQIARGSVQLDDHSLMNGDGAAITDFTPEIIVKGTDQPAEFLLFDLPAA